MRFVLPGFHKGVVNPSWAAKHGSQEQTLGVSHAHNVFLDSDGSLSRRYGTELFRRVDDLFAGQTCRFFSYSVADQEYVVLLLIDTNVSANSRIVIFSYDAPSQTWVTAPVAFGESNTVLGVGSWSPYINTAADTATTSKCHWYGVLDAPEITSAQFEDRLFIMHPNFPTVMIQRRPTGSWRYDPYFMERNPPYLDGTRYNCTWSGIQRPAQPINWDFTTSKPMFDKNGLPSTTSVAGTTAGFCSWDGVNPVQHGAIYRFGNMAITSTATGAQKQSVGAYWMMREMTSPTQALLTPLMHQVGAGSAGETYGTWLPAIPGSYAGPWYWAAESRTGLTVTVAHGKSTAYLNVAGDWSLADVGCIVVSTAGAGRAFLIREMIVSSPFRVVLMNLTQDCAAFATGTMQLYRPEHPVVIVTDNTGGFNAQGVDVVIASGSRGAKPMPAAHVDAYVDVAWIRKGAGFGTGDELLGGPIFHGQHGISRADSVTVLASTPSAYHQKIACWQQVIDFSIGAFRDYGFGPSKGMGFPSCGVPHQQRMWFSGFKAAPATVVASAVNRVDDYNALLEATLADGPLNLQLAFVEGDLPKWMVSYGQNLVIGGETNEYILSGAPVSNSSLGFQRVGNQGGSVVTPAQIGPEIVWVGNDGRDVYKSVFEDRHNSVVTSSLLRGADKLFEDSQEKIIQIEHLGAGDRRLFFLTSYGRLLIYNHSPEYGTVGWTSMDVKTWHEDDTIQSIGKVRNLANNGWELWIQTLRTVGTPKRYLEAVRNTQRMDMVKTPSAKSATSATFPDLISVPIGIIIDGRWGGIYQSNGSGIIDYTSLGLVSTPTTMYGGAVFEYNVLMHFPSFALDSGPSAGAILNLGQPILFLEDSVGGSIQGKTIQSVPLNSTPSPITGWRQVPGASVGPKDRFPQVEISQTLPFEFKLCSVALEGGGN